MNSTHRNAINWFEIAVTDIKQAAAFYRAVTGQPLEVMAFDGRAHAVFSPRPSGAPADGGVHGALVEKAMQGPSPSDGEAGASETMSALRGPTTERGGTVVYLDIADRVQHAL